MDMDRRGFLKLLGGLAALPVVGKVFKFSKKAVEAAPKVLKDQGMPDFFYDLVAGVKKFGKKKGSGRDYDVYEFTDPKTKRKVEVIDGRDEVGVSFETDKGFRGEMGVKKGMPDETTKGKTPPDEYYEGEEVYRSIGGDGYTKDFEEGISGGYQGLEELSKRIGKSGGGIAGSPPVYQTNDPNEAAKVVIDAMMGGSGIETLPIYSGDNLNINAGVGVGAFKPFDYGINFQYGDFGGGAQVTDDTRSMGIGYNPDPLTRFGVDYSQNTERGPMFGLQYERRFADGGRAGYIRGGPVVTSAIKNQLNRELREKQKKQEQIQNKTSRDSLMRERREQIIPALKSANVISDNDVSRILEQYGLISLAEGGIASGPPPERGPMPQGLETLFQTR
jgi:hypothetical protein